jgi:hypothetical protein
MLGEDIEGCEISMIFLAFVEINISIVSCTDFTDSAIGILKLSSPHEINNKLFN